MRKIAVFSMCCLLALSLAACTDKSTNYNPPLHIAAGLRLNMR